MLLQMNPNDAAKLGLEDGQLVIAYNEHGEVTFTLKIVAKIPEVIFVIEGGGMVE